MGSIVAVPGSNQKGIGSHDDKMGRRKTPPKVAPRTPLSYPAVILETPNFYNCIHALKIAVTAMEARFSSPRAIKSWL